MPSLPKKLAFPRKASDDGRTTLFKWDFRKAESSLRFKIDPLLKSTHHNDLQN
jgi:hypothetical protein